MITLFFTLLLAYFQPSHSQEALVTQNSSESDAVLSLVESFMTFNHIPGASVSISRAGELVYSQGFGFADLEQMVPVVPDETCFRVGSVSKPFTAAALAKLYEQQKINLLAPIQEYVPSFPEKRWPINLRQLAGHVAGIRHYQGNEFLSTQFYPTVEEGLSIFKEDTLLFKPNSDYRYSSYGWNLISAAIEHAANQAFLEYVQEFVFDPLGMENTYTDYVDSLIPFRTRFYTRSAVGKMIHAPMVDNSYKWAGGGFLSTTEDLVRFGNAHLPGGFLQDSTLKRWITPQRLEDGTSTNYGMGWRSGIDGYGKPWYGHSGGSVGGVTQLLIYPKEEIVVAVLTNKSPVDYGDLHFQLANIFMPSEKEALPTIPKGLIGQYAIAGENTFPLEIKVINGKIHFRLEEELPQRLIQTEDGTFHSLNGIWEIHFPSSGFSELELTIRTNQKTFKGKRL